jgi:tetratricopeptide (TPR) repeat protein
MKCSNCNEKILKEDKFCGNCGAKIIRSQHNGPQGNKIKNTKENQKKIENKKVVSEVNKSKNKIEFDLISKILLFGIICSFFPIILMSVKNINKSELYLSEAKDFFQKDSLTKSIIKINQSIATYYRPESIKLKAEIKEKQRLYTDAAQLYKSLIEGGYKMDSLRIDYGYTLVKSNEFAKGMDYLTKALQSENKRKYPIRYVNEVLGNSEKQTNKNLLISLATMNIDLENDRDIQSLFTRARVYYLLEMYKETINDYSEYIEKNPSYWGSYLNRGMALYHYKEYKGSINDLNKVLNLDIEDKWMGQIYNYLAKSYSAINQYRKSYQFFKKAINKGFSVSTSIGSDYWFVKRQLNIK